MPEANDHSTNPAAAGSRPQDPRRSTDPESPRDAEIDEALENALKNPADQGATSEVPLKRMWDEELDAELEAAMSGFDPSTFEVAAPRAKRADRAPVAKGDRGQEARPGPRKGRVISARGRSLFIDLGGKSEGVIPLDQFEGEIPAPGTDIDIIVDHFDRSEGIVHLRLKGAAIEANWDNLREGVIVEARVTKAIKGGVEVDVDGIRGFMPISQIDLNRVEDAADYINQKLRAIVTEANQREKNLVISRRELLERERAELREKTWATLEEGQTRKGVVRSVKDFGAFVDIGGVDGLLPIGEMSWARLAKVEDLIRPGDQVTVKVLRINPTERKVTFGLKQLQPSPWENVEDKYARGAMIKGKVSKLMDFGAFVELEPGVEGLIHITELSPTRVRRVSDIVQPGQEVEVRVLRVEPDAKRIALSLLPLAKGFEPEEEEDDDEDETPRPPKPERKVPLKGGLGDRDADPFPGR